MRPRISAICASACSALILPFSASLPTWPAGHVRGLVQARLDERLVDVLQHHGDARRGDCLGDLATHRSCADDSGLEHEHAWVISP